MTHRVRHKTTRPGIRAKLVLALIALALGVGCSAGKAPSGRWIDCGPPIPVDAVTLLDVTRFGEDAAAVDRHVREQVGAYRLFTPQPVGIRIDEDAFANGGAERVRPARERAASLGCDLLLLMHPDRVTYGYSNPARSNQAGSYEVPVLVVLMGRLEE